MPCLTSSPGVDEIFYPSACAATNGGIGGIYDRARDRFVVRGDRA
jgi:hypothetical protein